MSTDEVLAKSFRFADLIEHLVSEHATARKAAQTGAVRGPITGIEELDGELGGFLAPGLHILQAAPGVGKTAFGLQTCEDCGSPSVYVTAEMGVPELFRRTIARTTSTHLDVLTSIDLGEERLRELAQSAAEKHAGTILLDATSRRAPIESIEVLIEDLLCESDAQPLVLVDSLQAWARAATPSGGYYAADYEIVSRGVRSLLELAANFHVPVLCIAQRNRAGQERGGMFASKGTGDIEYCAESVLELTRNTDAQADSRGEIPVKISILKNRHGSAGAEIDLRFSGGLQSFRQHNARRRH